MLPVGRLIRAARAADDTVAEVSVAPILNDKRIASDECDCLPLMEWLLRCSLLVLPWATSSSLLCRMRQAVRKAECEAWVAMLQREAADIR